MEFQPLGDFTMNIGYDSYAANGGNVEVDRSRNAGGGTNFGEGRTFGLAGLPDPSSPGVPGQVEPILPDPNYSLAFPYDGGANAWKGAQYKEGPEFGPEDSPFSR